MEARVCRLFGPAKLAGLPRRCGVAADITHDFHREGGFKEDFTAELRISTFFLPASEAMK